MHTCSQARCCRASTRSASRRCSPTSSSSSSSPPSSRCRPLLLAIPRSSPPLTDVCALTCSVRCRSCCWRSRSSRSTSTLATSTRHASTQTSTRRRSLLGTFPAPPCRYDNLDEDDHEAEDDGHAFSAGDAFIHQGVCAPRGRVASHTSHTDLGLTPAAPRPSRHPHDRVCARRHLQHGAVPPARHPHS